MELLQQYTVPLVVGLCLCVGYMLKNLIPTPKINRYIPLILGGLGAFFQCWMCGFLLTPEILFAGTASGLSSTGVYELFRNLVEGKK